MLTGQRNKQITIRAFTTTELESGQEVKSWSDLITMFGNVKYITGNESNQANQKVATKKMVVTIYKNIVPITEQNQLVIDGLNYAIVSITPTEDDFDLELEVERRDNNNNI